MMEKKDIPTGYKLRVGIRGQGCSGVRHFLAFDKPKDSDDIIEFDGLEVIYDKKQALYLAGFKIDFEDRGEERGFFFDKEN